MSRGRILEVRKALDLEFLSTRLTQGTIGRETPTHLSTNIGTASKWFARTWCTTIDVTGQLGQGLSKDTLGLTLWWTRSRKAIAARMEKVTTHIRCIFWIEKGAAITENHTYLKQIRTTSDSTTPPTTSPTTSATSSRRMKRCNLASNHSSLHSISRSSRNHKLKTKSRT